MKKNTLLGLGLFLGSLSITLACSLNSETPHEVMAVATPDPDPLVLSTGPEEDERFFYNVGPRFGGVKQSTLRNATQLADFLDPDFTEGVERYQSVKLFALGQDAKISGAPLSSSSELLSEAQRAFFQNAAYGSNFMLDIEGQVQRENGQSIIDRFTPHLTVVPEIQAEYGEGNQNLIRLIRRENQSQTVGIYPEDLDMAKLYFQVSAEGEVQNVIIDQGTGYPSYDLNVVRILKETSGQWIPAKNVNGEAISQDLVLFFGMPGC